MSESEILRKRVKDLASLLERAKIYIPKKSPLYLQTRAILTERWMTLLPEEATTRRTTKITQDETMFETEERVDPA